MKDADDTDISGDSDTTGDEQNENEGDETGDNSDDNTTPDRENPDGDQNVSDDSEGEDQPSADGPNAGSGEELTDENKPAEEEAAEDADEVSDKVTVNDSSVNAVTPTAVTISVKQYEKDGTPATEEGGKATDRELTGSEKAAAVTFIDGTSADDSKALGGSRPVKFLLDMEDGWKEEGLAVTYSIPSDTDSQKKEKVSLSKGANIRRPATRWCLMYSLLTPRQAYFWATPAIRRAPAARQHMATQTRTVPSIGKLR